MAQPSDKAPEYEQFLTETFGFNRREHIEANKCCPEPIGCARQIIPVVDPQRVHKGAFRDALSLREYTISGLCQLCQDKVFTAEEE